MKCDKPNCDHAHDIEVDLPEPKVIQGTISTPQILTPATTVAPAPIVEEEKPRKLKHEELEEIMPKGVNFTRCIGSDCGHQKLENPKPITKFKACPNCKNNSVPKSSDLCPTCGLDEQNKKFEEWDESDIEIEDKDEE